MMFHMLYGATEAPAWDSTEPISYSGDLSAVAQPSDQQLWIGTPRDDVMHFAPKMGTRIAVNRDVGDVAEIGSRFLQAIGNC